MSAWRTHRNIPTGRLPPCSAQMLWPVSPLSPACCPREQRVRPSSPAKTPTSPVCPPSSPAQTTAGHHPLTGTAQVGASCPLSLLISNNQTQSWLLSTVRQVLSSSSTLSNLQLLDGPGSHSLGSPYNPSASTWGSSPFAKPPLHSHATSSLYTPHFATPREGYSSPSREGRESPQLQDSLKMERLSPPGALGGSGSFLNLTNAPGNMYSPSSHAHMLSPYSPYMTAPQDYNPAALYSTPGSWINPSFSPKLHSKMRISTPGERRLSFIYVCVNLAETFTSA